MSRGVENRELGSRDMVFDRWRRLCGPAVMMAESPYALRTDPVAERISTLRRALEGIIGVPATKGNSLEVLRNGNEIFPAMLESIAGATRTIDLLTFIYWRGEIGTRFAEALSARARAGVRVRVLLDAWGRSQLIGRSLRRWTRRGAHPLVPPVSSNAAAQDEPSDASQGAGHR